MVESDLVLYGEKGRIDVPSCVLLDERPPEL
jgi:hypothetical protein